MSRSTLAVTFTFFVSTFISTFISTSVFTGRIDLFTRLEKEVGLDLLKG